MDGLAGLYPGANRFPEHRRADGAFPVSSETITHVQSRSVSGSGNSISLAYASNNTAGNFLALRLTAVPSSVSISNCSDTRGNAGACAERHWRLWWASGDSVREERYSRREYCHLYADRISHVGNLDIFEKSGVDRTSPLDQSKLTNQVDPGTGTDAISSGSVTTTADGELILGATLQVGSTRYSASEQFSGTQGPVGITRIHLGQTSPLAGSYWAGTGI